MHRTCRGPAALTTVLLAAALATAAAAAGDEWLVYVGGGLEPIDGPWSERRGQVLFTQRGGSLVSVPYDDVDLAASTFITWQLAGRRQAPPRAPLPQPAPEGGDTTAAQPCVPARVVGLRGGETLEIATATEREIVHVACLDAPETQHKFSELGWFGRTTASAIELAMRRENSVCLTEQTPPQRDGHGHRVLFVTLEDGRDYTASVISGGLGLLRPAGCERAARYRQLEDGAIAGQRGLWGPMASRPAFAAVNHTAAVSAGPPPPRAAAGRG